MFYIIVFYIKKKEYFIINSYFNDCIVIDVDVFLFG